MEDRTNPFLKTNEENHPSVRTDWLDRFFSSYYAHRPVNATFIGLHDWDHLLPDLSENGVGDTLAEMASLLAETEGLWTAADLQAEALGHHSTDFEGLDRRMAEGFLRIQLWEYRSDHFQRGNPSLYAGEAIFSVLSLFLTDFSPLKDRMDAATARLAGVPHLLAQGKGNVRRAPTAWTQRAIRECTGALAFLTDGVRHLGTEGIPGEPAFRRAAEVAARAFGDFRHHLESVLLQHANQEVACGEEALSLYLQEGHFLTQTPDWIVDYAEAEAAEAEGDLARSGYDPEEASRALIRLHPAPDQYYGRYQEIWDAVRRRAEEQSLLTWPDFPIRYRPRPMWARKGAPYLYFLFYRSPAAFNRPPVHDYLVTPIDPEMPNDQQEELLKANNDSVIKLNHVIHHGSIGHHVQNWHAFRSASRIGQVAAVDCASRIAMFCGGTMAEGWACYATDLMREAGGLTEFEALAELKGRTRMCARAVVDVRLHQGRFTLKEAEDYYVRHAGMTPSAAHAEAVKNSMFPGAAVIYLLGTDAIHDLRATLAARLGSAFDLCRFHDDFLSHGSIPVPLIAERMTRAEASTPDGPC